MSKILRTVDNLSTAVGFVGNTGHTENIALQLHKADLQSTAAVLEMATFIATCYQQRDGLWLVIYPDGLLPRGLILPWARHAPKQRAALRRPQRDILRRFMLVHQDTRPLCPFFYVGRQWYLELQKFPTEEKALTWLEVITPKRWLEYASEQKRAKVGKGEP